MVKNYISMKLEQFKDKFDIFSKHRKKVKALENVSSCTAFKHQSYLGLIKECLAEGFLEEQEDAFLEHMLQKYEVNYLDWCYKTKWLKNEMSKLASVCKKTSSQIYFDMESLMQKQSMPNIPVHILKQGQGTTSGVRI